MKRIQHPAATRWHRVVSTSVCALIVTLGILASAATAQQRLPTLSDARSLNDDTVGIVFHYEDYYRRLVKDVGSVLGESAGVRVVPVIGGTHVQSVYDLLYMNGIDLSLIHADVLEYIARTQDYNRVFERIHSLVKLYDERFAVIASAGYESLDDLAGHTVNFGSVGSSSDISSTLLYDTLGIDVTPARLGKVEGLEKVKSGEIAATLYLLEDDPAPDFGGLTLDDQVTLLEIPQTDALLQLYEPAELTADQFPGLIAAEEVIPTISLAVIIASYNWPPREQYRYAKLKRFVEAFVAGQERLKSSGHEDTWQSVSFEDSVPGIERLALVDEMIEQQRFREQQLAAEEAELMAAELQAEQERITQQLTVRLGDKLSEVSDPEELKNMLDQLRQVLEGVEPSE